MTIRKSIAAIAVVLALGVGAALAFGITNNDGNCHEQTVAKAVAKKGDHSLTVINPPEGAVASGGGQRISVSGHQATLKGPGKLAVVCR